MWFREHNLRWFEITLCEYCGMEWIFLVRFIKKTNITSFLKDMRVHELRFILLKVNIFLHIHDFNGIGFLQYRISNCFQGRMVFMVSPFLRCLVSGVNLHSSWWNWQRLGKLLANEKFHVALSVFETVWCTRLVIIVSYPSKL